MQFSSALLSINLTIVSLVWRPRVRFLASKWSTHIPLLRCIPVSSSILYLEVITMLMPLPKDNRLLVLDLLSVHLIRNIKGSTIISFHPSLNLPTTTAPFLHERIRFAGELFRPALSLPCWKFWKFRSKRVLAKHFPKNAWPNICPVNICLACHVCLGWSSWESLWAYLLLGKLKTCGWLEQYIADIAAILAGNASHRNFGNASYPRTSYHSGSPPALHVAPRWLREAHNFHSRYP